MRPGAARRGRARLPVMAAYLAIPVAGSATARPQPPRAPRDADAHAAEAAALARPRGYAHP